jgi:hypothetical protein
MILAVSSFFVCWEFVTRHPGLVLVLAGVVGEVICDWKEMDGRLARAKRLSAILLVVGLMMEFWEAAKSDLEVARLNQEAAAARLETAELKQQIAETTTNLAKIDPRNANISDMSATAILMVMGTNFNDLTPVDSTRVAKITLLKNESIGVRLDTLRAENFTHNDFTVLFGVRDRREYGIRFHSFNFNAANGIENPVKTIDDVHIVRMDLSFLPRDTEIAGGVVELVVNNEKKMFEIPRQNDTNSNMGGMPGFPCFVIATNGVESSEKQFLYLRN